jgi:bacillithiol system protein YtxJ
MMTANFLKITSLDHLDELFERSKAAPVLLFKHSNRCGISSHLMEMVGQIDADVHFVVVQENRAISDAIAERTGYRTTRLRPSSYAKESRSIMRRITG